MSIRRWRRKPDYEHIAQLERENAELDRVIAAALAPAPKEPPRKRELFKPPLLAVKPLLQHHSMALTSYSPGTVWHVNDPSQVRYWQPETQALLHKAGLHKSAIEAQLLQGVRLND